ncbi:MAG: L,D-transpeptidase family protein [Candidatus Kapaibacterium sp.]
MQLLRDKMKQRRRSVRNSLISAPLLVMAAVAISLVSSCARTESKPDKATMRNVSAAEPPRGKQTLVPVKVPAKEAKDTSIKRPRFPDPPWTVAKMVDAFGAITRKKFEGPCRAAGIPCPPVRLTFLAFKRERLLEIWGAGEEGAYRKIGGYPILAASGGPGPKRREGDRQVPEGFYDLPELNPNSSLHLSIRIGYPNRDDIANAGIPVNAMGGDIYLHGKAASIGCIAVGDPAIEEIFTLVAQVTAPNRRIIISPVDFRRNPRPALPKEEKWVGDLYGRLSRALEAFPVAGAAGGAVRHP